MVSHKTSNSQRQEIGSRLPLICENKQKANEVEEEESPLRKKIIIVSHLAGKTCNIKRSQERETYNLPSFLKTILV